MNNKQKVHWCRRFLIAWMISSLIIILAPVVVFATTNDPGGVFVNLANNWLGSGGQVGTFVAILAASGGAIAYAIPPHRASSLVHGLIGGAIVGGIVGLATTMHNIGATAFNAP